MYMNEQLPKAVCPMCLEGIAMSEAGQSDRLGSKWQHMYVIKGVTFAGLLPFAVSGCVQPGPSAHQSAEHPP